MAKHHSEGKSEGSVKTTYKKDPAFPGTSPEEDRQPKQGPHGGSWDGTGPIPKGLGYPKNVYPTDVWDNHKDKD